MKKILLFQFRTDASLAHEVKCITEKMGISRDQLDVYNTLEPGIVLPTVDDLDNYAGVITGASGQFFISNWPDEIRIPIEHTLPLFLEIVRRDMPMLAICFGHQIIAKLLGGEVKRDSAQSETGTLTVTLNEAGRAAAIFKDIPEKFNVVLAHKDSVIKLPTGAKLLAYSQRCRIQAYQIGKNIFATQFHAELNLDDMVWRLQLYPDYLKEKTLQQLRSQYQEITFAQKILENFKNMTIF